jgi:DNA-directed RNA polymerase specialized sigma24 family protein
VQVIHQLWKGRRVRVAGVLDQVAVDCRDDLAAIYRDYWELVYRRCYATLQDHEAALDATQDVFVQALHSFEDIQNDIVRRLVDLARTISYERKRRPTREVALSGAHHANGGADDPAEIAERHRMLASVWSGLSVVERRYVADKFAGFSFEEIARRNRRALGTVSSNLARAREHARRMREPLLPGVLALAAWRRLTDASRRARNLAQSSTVAAAAQPVGTFTVSLTVAGLIASAVPVAVAATAGGSPWRSALASATLPEAIDGATTASSTLGEPIKVTAAPATRPPSGDSSGLSLPRLLPGGSAAAETPEDTQIFTATASPNYAQDHTIVALGYGKQCGCQALLMSTDGGADWQAADGPPSGDQIVLPPAFPRDPAIYVGYSSGATTELNNYWTPRFGVGFQQLQRVPAGALALPAGFDDTDHRIVSSTPAGVWSTEVGSASPQPLLVETQGTAPATSVPLDSPSTGLMVLTSSQAVGSRASVAAISTHGGETLWSCPPAQPCLQVAALALPTGAQLVASSSYGRDRSVVAYLGGELYESADGGKSFGGVDLPWVGAQFFHVVLAPTQAGTALWATVSHRAGWALMTRPSSGGNWAEADGGNRAITGSGGRLIVVSAQRLLFLPAQGGLLCSVNGGVTWEARCPSA